MAEAEVLKQKAPLVASWEGSPQALALQAVAYLPFQSVVSVRAYLNITYCQRSNPTTDNIA